MSHNTPNGAMYCSVQNDWPTHKEEMEKAMEKILDTHKTMTLIHEDTKHLSGMAESLKAVAGTLLRLEGSLLAAVLGKDIVPVGVTQTMLEEQRKSYVTIIKTLSWAFATVLVVVIGLKMLAPHVFGG